MRVTVSVNALATPGARRPFQKQRRRGRNGYREHRLPTYAHRARIIRSIEEASLHPVRLN
jgi:hypothetical protein